jgi:hypothetical protein
MERITKQTATRLARVPDVSFTDVSFTLEVVGYQQTISSEFCGSRKSYPSDVSHEEWALATPS